MRTMTVIALFMVLLANISIVFAQNTTTAWYEDTEQFIIVILSIGFILWSIKKESILLSFIALFIALIGYGLGYIGDSVLFILAIASIPSIVYGIIRKKV